jgi:hypothetical protein
MIADAVVLARVLVLPRPCLTAKWDQYLPCLASFGCTEAPRWSEYVDIARTTVHLHTGEGEKSLSARLNFVWEDEFLVSGEGAKLSHAHTLSVTWRDRVPRSAREQWRLVVRDMSGVPNGHYARRAQLLPRGISLTLDTPPSSGVAHIAAAARDWLGEGYAAVHVRRRDFLPRKRCVREGEGGTGRRERMGGTRSFPLLPTPRCPLLLYVILCLCVCVHD